MPPCGPVRIPPAGKKGRRSFSTFSPRKELFGGCPRMGICKVLIQNGLQVGASSPFEMHFVLFQKAQTSADDLGLIIKTAGRYESVNHLFKMGSNDFAHDGYLQQFGTVVNQLPGTRPPL